MLSFDCFLIAFVGFPFFLRLFAPLRFPINPPFIDYIIMPCVLFIMVLVEVETWWLSDIIKVSDDLIVK